MKNWFKKHWKKVLIYSVILDTLVYVVIPTILVLMYFFFGIEFTLPLWAQ